MAGVFTCPDTDDLHRFLLGEPSGMAKDLEKHLLECPSCCKRARTLKAEDTLVSALRTPAIIRYELSDTVEALMERLEGLSQPESASADPSNVTASDASHGDATPTPGSLPARKPLDNTKDLYEFLAPAREPGELGRLGPYRVLKVLGAGGMGVVFQAEDSRLKRAVALKVMKPSLAASASARQRFLREAQMTAAIEHDHIVAIFQADEDRGIPFLAMPLLKGETLDDRLQREGKLPEAEVVRIGREIALGLAAAHDGKLIHRDIKPSNIWLEGKQGRVKILDFGLVRAIDDDANLTSSGAVAGTPRYMAPEQASGTKVDQRCDLFSLGCVLYRMSTGQVPFQGSGTMQVLRSLEMEEPKPPRELNPDLPPALSTLILKLLTKDRAGRPGSAAAVAEELAAIERELAANSGAIGQPPALAPARRSAPRGRVPLVAAAVLLLALLPLGYWFAPTLIRVATSKGELVVETDGRDVEVSVKQEGVTLHDRVKDRKFELKAGDGEVEVFEAASGLRLFTKKFTIERGGTRIVSVRVELANASGPVQPKDKTMMPMEKLPDAADRDRPFVLVRAKDNQRQEFKHLTSALVAMNDRDAIEVHGNGPFVVPPVKIEGKRFTLRAGDGYRPVFVPAEETAYWFHIKSESAQIEGCQFRCTKRGGLCFHEGGKLRLVDCHVCCVSSGHQSLITLGPNSNAELSNDLILGGSWLFSLAAPGGQKIRIDGTTVGVGVELFLPSGKIVDPVSVIAEENLLWASHPLVDSAWKGSLKWQGRYNLYVQPYRILVGQDGAKDQPPKGLAGWKKFWQSEEAGSQESNHVLFHWEGMACGPTETVVRDFKKLLQELQRKHNLPNLGPDWDLVGPGNGYLRALAAAAGKPIPKDQLRPEPPVGGPFVLFHEGKLVRGFFSLPDAVRAAAAGDTVEIRTDGPIPECVLNGNDRLTLRAAPGYQPVVDGDLATHFDQLTIEGLRFHKGSLQRGTLHRIANCVFDSVPHIAAVVTSNQGPNIRTPNPGKKSIVCEIINCVIPGGFHCNADRYIVRNSVVGPFYVDLKGGTVELDRTMARSRDYLIGPGSEPMSVSAKDTLFDIAYFTYHAKSLTRWNGTRNLYRIGPRPWWEWVGAKHPHIRDLAGWQKQWNSDPDSREGDQLEFDPLQWRLAIGSPGYRAGPNGKDLGADVDRVARRVPGRKTEPFVQPVPMDKRPSPLDRLDPSQILAEERFPWQPTELVAVLGEHRQRHWGVVTGVAFSPDGKVAASSGGDGVRLWDAATMREIAFAKHPRRLSSVAISPDGKTLAAGDPFGVQLWDLSLAGVQERSLLKGDGVLAVAFAPDGKSLAAGGEEKVVRLWDLTGPEPKERAVLKGHTDPVLTLAFVPGGKTLVSGSQDKTVRLWDITGAEPRPGAVLQHKGAVRSLALAGNRLASASEDGSLRLWDLGAAEPKGLIVKEGLEFDSFKGSLAFGPDGKSLATAGNNPVVRLWDVSGTELKERGVLEAHLDRQNQGEKPPGGSNHVTSVAFSPDGKTLVSGEVATVRLWDLTAPVPKERGRIRGHSSAIHALTFTPDGTTLASGGGDATIRLWDLSKPAAQNPRLFSNNLSGAASLAFSPNGRVLASAFNLQLWDLATAAPRFISDDYWGMFTRDGKMLVSGGPNFEVRLWDMGGAEPRQRTGIKGQSIIGVLAPDGKTLACGDTNGTLRLWDLSGAEPRERAVLLKEHKRKILSLAFSPDVKTLAAGDWDAKIRLWNLDERQPKEPAVLQGNISHSLAFAPNGLSLAAAHNGQVTVWDPATGKNLRTWDLPGWVGSVAFAPDGRHLATGNGNGTIYILRLAPAPKTSNK